MAGFPALELLGFVDSMLQVFFNGFAVGLGIGVLGLGFLLVYRPTGVFHIAGGAIYAAIPFLLIELLGRGLPVWLALITCVGSGIVLSGSIEFLNHRWLSSRSVGPNAHLLSSLGLYIILVQLVIMVWGANVRSLRTEQDHAFPLGFLIVTRAQLLAITIQPAVLLAFATMLRFTRIGLQLRGLMQNPSEMALMGYSTLRLRLMAFALSGFFIAVVALVSAYDLGFDPRGGLSAIVLAIAAVVVGGRDTFAGPIIGGVLLGILRSVAVWYSPRWQDSVTFVLLAICLLFLPNGVLGFSKRLETQ